MRGGRAGKERLQIAHFERQRRRVRDFAHDFTHQQRFAVPVNGFHLLGRLEFPWRFLACRVRALVLLVGAAASAAHHTYLNDVKQQFAAIVAQFCEFRVKIEGRERRRNENGRGAFHLHERHDDLVEDAQVHVCR